MSKNISTYKGVKVSKETSEYFSNATTHFANAQEAAVNCATYAAKTAGYGYKVLGSAFMGACAYEVVAGKVMTGHAFGWAMPTFAKAAISTAAWGFYAHPTVAMVGFVGATLLYSPENSIELLKNAAYTVGEAANFAYENTAGIVNGVAGLGHFIYDNLPGSEEITLAGTLEASQMLAIGA